MVFRTLKTHSIESTVKAIRSIDSDEKVDSKLVKYSRIAKSNKDINRRPKRPAKRISIAVLEGAGMGGREPVSSAMVDAGSFSTSC